MRLLDVIERLHELGCTDYKEYSEDIMCIKDSDITAAENKVCGSSYAIAFHQRNLPPHYMFS
jgi:lipoate-protein ligase A